MTLLPHTIAVTCLFQFCPLLTYVTLNLRSLAIWLGSPEPHTRIFVCPFPHPLSHHLSTKFATPTPGRTLTLTHFNQSRKQAINPSHSRIKHSFMCVPGVPLVSFILESNALLVGAGAERVRSHRLHPQVLPGRNAAR
jgi:hypothetical protein